MHSHLEKVLAVALHPNTCDGEATAAFHAARRLAAKGVDFPLRSPPAESAGESFSCQSKQPDSEQPAAHAGSSVAWRVSLRAERLHEFVGLLIGRSRAAQVQLTLLGFALLGYNVHQPSRLEFSLSGPGPCVEELNGWIQGYFLRAGLSVRSGRWPAQATWARCDSAHSAN